MNIAARPDYPARDDWVARHGGHGHALWHAGPVMIGVMVLGFIFCWPVGVAALAITIWSVKMGCGHYGREGHWAERWQERMMERRARWEERMARHHSHQPRSTSGNRAFDEYRAETLRRLEDEEKEFSDFLNQLRFAKDKAEFDDFLANRRPPSAPEAGAPPQN